MALSNVTIAFLLVKFIVFHFTAGPTGQTFCFFLANA